MCPLQEGIRPGITSLFSRAAIFTFILSTAISKCHGVRILSVPQNINSHVIDHARVAHALVQEGHEITMVLSSNIKVPVFLKNTSVTFLRYNLTSEIPFMNTAEVSKMFVDASVSRSIISTFPIMQKLGSMLVDEWQKEAIEMLEDKVIRQHLKVTKYDVALVDSSGVDSQAVLPIAHDIPIITYGIMPFGSVYRIPTLPSFMPMIMTSFSDEMSFIERLQNTLCFIAIHLMFNKNNLALYDGYAPTKEITNVMDVYRNAILWLVLDDPAIAYPQPTMPNVVHVGDVIPQTANKLPGNVEEFVNAATDGAVVVSFGSFVDHLPSDVASELCSAFHKIPQRVIWKLKNRALCHHDPKKILLLDWIPQNDLLGHQNVKLFISHCGMNSILESVYHGTPILGVPIAIDQPYNAARVHNKGFGLQMELRDFSEEELVKKVSTIINSKDIQNNVQKASQIMKDKAVTPAKRLSFWINHVVKYGDKHLRSGAFKLNDLQFYMIDILFTVVSLVLGFMIGLCLIFCCSVKCIKYTWRRCTRKSKAMKKD